MSVPSPIRGFTTLPTGLVCATNAADSMEMNVKKCECGSYYPAEAIK